MLSIIITIMLIVCAILFLAKTKLKDYDVIMIVAGILLIGICTAISPIYGFHEAVLAEEIELVSLDDESDVFVSRSLNGVYSYKYEIENPYNENETSYEVNIIRGNVIETESENCTNPVLKKYVRKAKQGLFSFCLSEEIEYEFYVPVDTIEESNVTIN